MAQVATFVFPHDVQGWLSPEEGEALYRYASECASVVELGSYKGRSTICLAQGAPTLAVDHMKGSAEVRPGYYGEFMLNIKRYGVHVDTLIEDSVTAASIAPDCEMLFVDGDHGNAVRDVTAWRGKVSRYIALHDSETGDVPAAIQSLNPEFTVVCTEGSLTVMQRA